MLKWPLNEGKWIQWLIGMNKCQMKVGWCIKELTREDKRKAEMREDSPNIQTLNSGEDASSAMRISNHVAQYLIGRIC